MHTATRYHDVSCGHTVDGHEGKCRFLHGHNYRIHFTCVPDVYERRGTLDKVGRVIDFGVIKTKLCQWLEDHWDHKFLVWEKDKRAPFIKEVDHTAVVVPFNPTAENMAQFLVEVVGPQQLRGTGAILTRVSVEETMKCSAAYEVTLS